MFKVEKMVLALSLLLAFFINATAQSQSKEDACFRHGELWMDDTDTHVNAHGGGILVANGRYYWFGEHKSDTTSSAMVGVRCYSSSDLYNWKNEGVALSVVDDKNSDITSGCVLERPKVAYNKKTNKYVLWFHLELKGRGYNAARVGVAVSDRVTGPYKFLRSYRPNPGIYPYNMSEEQKKMTLDIKDYRKSWTPEWYKAVADGLFVKRDLQSGQMSRDMTLYVDDDEKAYHIYSSEDNLTIQIAELTDDYQGHTGKYIRVAPAGHNEAPAILKKDGVYWMITSGCTGWDPNAARMFSSRSIWGPWTQHPNPCVGKDADKTFFSQSTYILPVQGRKDAFIFMADRWTPRHPSNARYIWLPIQFKDGIPFLKWMDKWDLSIFEELNTDSNPAIKISGYNLIWSDEFNYEGKPNSDVWSYENGFVRNEELQWYQPENADCHNGVLRISGRKEQIVNPDFTAGSMDWRKNRPQAAYTSACIKTEGKKEFLYGRFEIRAKIPTASGAWPAIWTLGNSMPWPSNGEIDIMEYYRINGIPHVLANTAWGTDIRGTAKWNSVTVPFSKFTDEDINWADKFHIWRMDWDKNAIRLYLDNRLLNETLLKDTQNGSIGNYKNPFHQPHYLLLNLAIGGINGGTPSEEAFPLSYEVDYVRVYQNK